MRRRRLLSATVLFVLAGVILVIMNRYSSFFVAESLPPAETSPTARQVPFEFFDSEDGSPRGTLVAGGYETLADGTADCRDVSFKLLDTSYGDVTLTCERALLRIDEIGKGVTGAVTLEGNVLASAVKDGLVVASGRFERVVYDASLKTISGDGRAELTWGQVLEMEGTGVSGNVEQMRFALERDIVVRVAAPSAGSASAPGALDTSSLPDEMTISAGGPLAYDARESLVLFAGGVEATGEGLSVRGGDLELTFESGESEPGEPPRDSTVTGLKITGDAEVKTADVTVAGERILWSAAEGLASVSGNPARIESNEYFVEAGELKAEFDDKDEIVTIEVPGAGTATVRADASAVLGNLSPEAAEPEESPAAPDPGESGPEQASGSTEETAGAATDLSDDRAPDELESISISWKDRLAYRQADRKLDISGDVSVLRDDASLRAAHMSLGLEPPPSQRIATFNAGGGVVLSNAGGTLEAESVVYDRPSDSLSVLGAPAAVTAGDAVLTANTFSYQPSTGLLRAARDCRLTITPGPAADSDEALPVSVTADEMSADMSGNALSAECSGNVAVRLGEYDITSQKLRLSGVTRERMEKAEGSDIPKTARIEGTGKIVLRRGDFTARGDSFILSEENRVLELRGTDASRVEMTYADAAVIWADSVTASGETDEVTCQKPQVVLSSKGMLLGFVGGAPKDPRDDGETVTKVYVNAGRMLFKREDRAKGLLVFDGGVDGKARNPDSAMEDEITAEKLEIDLAAEQGAAPGGDSTDNDAGSWPEGPRPVITEARASGGVTLRYGGSENVFQGRGDAFSWNKAADRGTLSGDPAVVWNGESSWKATEFIYDFEEDKVSLRGGRGGLATLRRKTAR